MELNWLDSSIIVVYGVAVVVLAAWFSREQQSSRDYLVAGRSMTWIPMAISQTASLLSAISYLGDPGEAYGHDLQFFFRFLVSFTVVPLVIYLFLNFFYRLGIVSTYEYLEMRFNGPTRVLASMFFIVLRITWMATIVSAVSLVIERLTGLPAWQCVLTTAVLSTFYTLLGGMKAIIWTDILQLVLFTAGALGALVVLLLTDPMSELLHIISRDDKLRMLDFRLDPTVRITTWAAIMGGGVAGLANALDQVSMQRYLAAKSLREAQKAVWIKPVISVSIHLLLFSLGLVLYAHYKLHPDLAIGVEKPDQAFPNFILTEIPHGLSGLLIAAIFAAAMSSIDSGIHSLSTVTVEDYYKRFMRPRASDRHYLILARALTLVWGAVITVVALSFSQIGTIVEMLGKLGSPFFGCILGIFMLGTTTRRATGWGAFLGGLCGYGLVLWVMLSLRRVDSQWHLFTWGLDDGKVTWIWYPAITFSGTFVTGYLISLLMPRPAEEKLRGLNLWDRHKDVEYQPHDE